MVKSRTESENEYYQQRSSISKLNSSSKGENIQEKGQ